MSLDCKFVECENMTCEIKNVMYAIISKGRGDEFIGEIGEKRKRVTSQSANS